MNKQILVPVSGMDDAGIAIAKLREVSEPGDEVTILAVSEVPDSQMIGSRPGPIWPMNYTGAAGSAGPPAPNDQPVFIGREELIELNSRELKEALANLTQPLRNDGIEVRVETVFSDEPSEAILDYARNIDAAEICVTSEFQKHLDDDDNEPFSRVIPGT